MFLSNNPSSRGYKFIEFVLFPSSLFIPFCCCSVFLFPSTLCIPAATLSSCSPLLCLYLLLHYQLVPLFSLYSLLLLFCILVPLFSLYTCCYLIYLFPSTLCIPADTLSTCSPLLSVYLLLPYLLVPLLSLYP